MKTLSEMSAQDLGDLRAKVKASVLELEAQINRNQYRLDDRVDRTTVNSTQQSELQARVTRATDVRDAVVAAGSAQSTIDNAEDMLSEAQTALNAHSVSPSTINDVDAYYTQMTIDELQSNKTSRDTVIADINAELGN